MRGDIHQFLPFRGEQKETNGISENTRKRSRRQRGRLSNSLLHGFIAGAQEGTGRVLGIRAYSSAVAESRHGFAVNFAECVLNMLQHLPFSTDNLAFVGGTGRIVVVDEA